MSLLPLKKNVFASIENIAFGLTITSHRMLRKRWKRKYGN